MSTSKFDIASTMNSIMASQAHKAVFARPDPFTKTAATKDADKAKEDKAKAKAKEDKAKAKAKEDEAKAKAKAKEDKAKAKAKEDKAKADAKAKAEKAKKKAMSQYHACVIGLAKISEVADDAGFSKAATYALLALDSLVKSAEKKTKEDEKKDKKDKKEEEEKEEKKKEEELEAEEEEEDEEEEDDDKDDIADAGGPGGEDPTMAKPTGTSGGPPELDWDPLHGNLSEGGDPWAWLNDVAKADDVGDAIPWKEDPELLSSYDDIYDYEERDEDELEGTDLELTPKHESSKGIDSPAGDDFSFVSALHGNDEEEDDGEGFDLESLLGRTNVASKASSLQKLASELTKTRMFISAGEKDPKAKVRNKSSAIFDNKHPKVKDDKDHFPIDTAGKARNALARCKQFSAAPPWWSGSLKDLQSAVSKAVKAKYPSIDVGGKGDKKDKK